MNAKTDDRLFAGVDLGAGAGAKIGVFDAALNRMNSGFVSVAGYGSDGDILATVLANEILRLQRADGVGRRTLAAVGVAAPGLFRSDGSFLKIHNLPFLDDVNLPRLIGARLDMPVAGLNDADAGGLAEWTLIRKPLLYWALGGGWGGAWVDRGGHVLFPAVDWDGRDASLHPTNEPGYSIPLDKNDLDGLFKAKGASFSRFEAVCASCCPSVSLAGPDGRADCVRAELLVSGPGRWRIFRMLAARDASWQKEINPGEVKALNAPETAGGVMDGLSRLRVPIAVKTDMLFAEAMALAARFLFERARRDGCPADIPLIFGGKPSRAFPFFHDELRKGLLAQGVRSRLTLSRLEQQGKNANMLGAAALARREAGGRPGAGHSV